ncbi:MAG TPA: glycosyltransferase [Blastocatellia bacterium]|nr:glycosyltransferase [Blastocatellia bacterium]
MNPKVSVCIPTYNTARYLADAIDSVLAQEFTDFELVICDNASTDETPEICRRYTDSRIRYVRFAELTNQAGNFNRCLNEARGEFITLLHADDYFLPGFLADRVNRLDEQSEVGFVFGAVQVVDSEGDPISLKSQWTEDQFFPRGELFRLLLSSCLICPPSLMVRRSITQKTAPFRRDLTWGHDWEWTLRLAENNAACYVARPLAAYREHDASGTAAILNAATNGRQERLILRETIERSAIKNDLMRTVRRSAFQSLSRRHMYFADQALLAGRRSITLKNLWYAALADPFMLTRPTFWALLVGSTGSTKLYGRYRSLRKVAGVPGTNS